MDDAEGQRLEERVLLLAPTPKDDAMTRHVLAGIDIDCCSCVTTEALCTELASGAGAVLLTEQALSVPDVRLFTEFLRRQPPWSDLPIVVLARGGAASPAGRHAMELFGNVTVLERPVSTASLASVLRTLIRSRRRQYQIREYLDERERAAQRLREARDTAEAASRAKDKFLAVLSHELRTPLSPVVMAIPAIEQDPELPIKFRDDLAMVRRNIDLEVKLIDDLLDLSRITSGKLRLQLQPVRLHELLRHVLNSNLSETAGKRLHVRHALDAGNDELIADPARLQQVFWNLLRNATKFTPEGGHISVRTCTLQSEHRVLVEISDDGVGIPPHHLARIFDAFEQGETRRSHQFGGLGLGLAIAKAVVEMHGGTITAASDGENQGTTFSVQLDLAPNHDAAALPASLMESEDGPGVRRPRVLLVEDHHDTARVLARLLRIAGYEVRSAHTVATALDLAAAEPFDVVVSDIGLPDGTGYELMMQIRDRHGIKGIALSGYGMEEDMRKSREAGFVDHVVKPVNLFHLESVIRRVTVGELTVP